MKEIKGAARRDGTEEKRKRCRDQKDRTERAAWWKGPRERPQGTKGPRGPGPTRREGTGPEGKGSGDKNSHRLSYKETVSLLKGSPGITGYWIPRDSYLRILLAPPCRLIICILSYRAPFPPSPSLPSVTAFLSLPTVECSFLPASFHFAAFIFFYLLFYLINSRHGKE